MKNALPLKPCPFCGKAPQINGLANLVWCCGSLSLAAWNRRAVPALSDAEVSAIAMLSIIGKFASVNVWGRV